MIKTIIKGVGSYVPDNIVTNSDLEKLMDTNDEWIVNRTGIKERRHRKDSKETTATMGAEAAKRAMDMAGVTAKDIDLILFATLSPDLYFPGCGVLIQELLGCDTIGAMDIRNQCAGFIYGLTTADAFIKAGMYKNILLIGAEIHSFGLDFSTRGRGVSVIFGDGAGAVVLQPTDNPNRGILGANIHSEGKYAEELSVRYPGTKYGWAADLDNQGVLPKEYHPSHTFPNMNGPFVFKNAIQRFTESINEVFSATNEKIDDLKLFIPHQANLRISQVVQASFELKDEQVFNNIQKYGNTTAATLPLCLDEALGENRFQEEDLICLSAFGSGFTWGSVLMRW